MDWRHLPSLTALRAFAAAAEHESLTRAARALNITHSAVSHQIRALETALGTRLIARTRHGITLTQQGEYLAEQLLEGFGVMGQATETISRAEAARPLLVSATPMFSAAFLQPRLAAFLSEHPQIELNIRSEIEIVELAPGGVDLAIRYCTGPAPGLQSEPLLPCCLTVVASSSLVAGHDIQTPADLLQFPILQEQGSMEFDRWLQKVGIPVTAPRKVVRVPGNMLLDGVRRGDGIGATVVPFVADELAAGSLRVLFDDPIPGIGYHLITRPGPRRAALKTFAGWLNASVTKRERRLYRWPPNPE